MNSFWIIAAAIAGGIVLFGIALWIDWFRWQKNIKPLSVIHDDLVLCTHCGRERIPPYREMCHQCNHDLHKGE